MSADDIFDATPIDRKWIQGEPTPGARWLLISRGIPLRDGMTITPIDELHDRRASEFVAPYLKRIAELEEEVCQAAMDLGFYGIDLREAVDAIKLKVEQEKDLRFQYEDRRYEDYIRAYDLETDNRNLRESNEALSAGQARLTTKLMASESRKNKLEAERVMICVTAPITKEQAIPVMIANAHESGELKPDAMDRKRAIAALDGSYTGGAWAYSIRAQWKTLVHFFGGAE